MSDHAPDRRPRPIRLLPAVLIAAAILSLAGLLARSPADFGAWTMRLSLVALLSLVAVDTGRATLGTRFRDVLDRSGLLRTSAHAVMGALIGTVVGIAIGVALTVALLQPAPYEYITAGDLTLWKIDRRTGETFLCAPHRDRDGYIIGSGCVLAQMPDWYRARQAR